MERTEIETQWYEDPSPAGSNRQGYVTYEEREQYLVNHIRAYLLRDEYHYLKGYPVLTVHRCWSGYSEYTVTAVWDEIGIEWDGHTAYFETTAAFFTALAAVDPSGY